MTFWGFTAKAIDEKIKELQEALNDTKYDSLADLLEDAIIAKIEKHHELLATWIKEDHTSRDGFISYLSNDIDQWPSRLFDDNEIRQPAYLFYMLYYIVKAEFIRVGVNVDLEHEAYGCICEGIDITAYMKEVEVMA